MTQEMINLISRLEKATEKLESIAGISPPSSTTSTSASNKNFFISAYDEFLSSTVDKYVEASKKCAAPVYEIALLVKEAFLAQRAFIATAGDCRKPNQSELTSLFKPQKDAIVAICNYQSKDLNVKNHIRAVTDSVIALEWVSQEDPFNFVKTTSEPADYFANKVLQEYKSKENPNNQWAKEFKSLWTGLANYVKEYHDKGFSYNPNGCSPKSCEEKVKPNSTTSAKATSGGTFELFSALNKGGDITKGLKKVDKSQMTHKNPALRASSVVPSETPKKETSTPKPTNTKTSEASYEHVRGKKHHFEFYKGDHSLKVPEPTIQENNILYKCENCTLQVKGKCNNIVINNCKKVAIVFHTVISCVEVNNSVSCQVQVLGSAPMITLDKVDGCQIYLSKTSLNTEIITAKTSEVNVNVSGETETEDPVEYSLPEQFKNVWCAKEKKFCTAPVTHG